MAWDRFERLVGCWDTLRKCFFFLKFFQSLIRAVTSCGGGAGVKLIHTRIRRVCLIWRIATVVTTRVKNALRVSSSSLVIWCNVNSTSVNCACRHELRVTQIPQSISRQTVEAIIASAMVSIHWWLCFPSLCEVSLDLYRMVNNSNDLVNGCYTSSSASWMREHWGASSELTSLLAWNQASTNIDKFSPLSREDVAQ